MLADDKYMRSNDANDAHTIFQMNEVKKKKTHGITVKPMKNRQTRTHDDDDDGVVVRQKGDEKGESGKRTLSWNHEYKTISTQYKTRCIRKNRAQIKITKC